MSKGIAIQTILLLLVGVIVAGVIVYLVYSYTTSSALDKNECMAIIMDQCTMCMNTGWDPLVAINNQKWLDCDEVLWGIDDLAWNDNTNCGEIVTKPDCVKLFPGMF